MWWDICSFSDPLSKLWSLNYKQFYAAPCWNDFATGLVYSKWLLWFTQLCCPGHFNFSASRLLKALMTFDLSTPVRTKPSLTTVDSFFCWMPSCHRVQNKLHSLTSPQKSSASVLWSNLIFRALLTSITEVRPQWHPSMCLQVLGYNGI